MTREERAAREAGILRDYLDGTKVEVICARYGIHRTSVPRLVRRADAALVRPPGLICRTCGYRHPLNTDCNECGAQPETAPQQEMTA